MEEVGVLDHTDSLDLYSLHFVFIPIIQQQLDVFREGWSHHSLRTEGNRTPLQLWILGLQHMHSQDTDNAAVSGLQVDYGIDWEGHVPLDEDQFC